MEIASFRIHTSSVATASVTAAAFVTSPLATAHSHKNNSQGMVEDVTLNAAYKLYPGHPQFRARNIAHGNTAATQKTSDHGVARSVSYSVREYQEKRVHDKNGFKRCLSRRKRLRKRRIHENELQHTYTSKKPTFICSRVSQHLLPTYCTWKIRFLLSSSLPQLRPRL